MFNISSRTGEEVNLMILIERPASTGTQILNESIISLSASSAESHFPRSNTISMFVVVPGVYLLDSDLVVVSETWLNFFRSPSHHFHHLYDQVDVPVVDQDLQRSLLVVHSPLRIQT